MASYNQTGRSSAPVSRAGNEPATFRSACRRFIKRACQCRLCIQNAQLKLPTPGALVRQSCVQMLQGRHELQDDAPNMSLHLMRLRIRRHDMLAVHGAPESGLDGTIQRVPVFNGHVQELVSQRGYANAGVKGIDPGAKTESVNGNNADPGVGTA